MLAFGTRSEAPQSRKGMQSAFLRVLLLCMCFCAAPRTVAQPRFEVRMTEDLAPRELRVSLALRGTESFGLGDAVIAIAYDTLHYHRAELVSAPVFGVTPYRPVELHTAGDSLSVGFFYDYRTRPGAGKRIGIEWTDVAALRFLLKTKQEPPMLLLPGASGVLRDDGLELLLRAD